MSHVKSLAIGAVPVLGLIGWLAAVMGRFGEPVALVVIAASLVIGLGLASYAVGTVIREALGDRPR